MSRRVELVLLHGSSASIPLHLQPVISSYLGPAPNVTLSKTCSFGSIALLDWMWEASCTRASERTPWWSLTNFLRSEPHYYRWQFAESMKVAAKSGNLAVVAWLLEHFRACEVPDEAVESAADNGHLHILKLLWDHDGRRLDRDRQDAKKRKVVTRSGDVLAQNPPGHNVVEWKSSVALYSSFRKRHRDVVRWLHEHTPPSSDCEVADAIQDAMDEEDWELANFLLPPGRCLLNYAAVSRNPEMIEWAFESGYLACGKNNAACAIRNLAGSSENLPLMQRIADQHKTPYSLEEFRHWRGAMDAACERGQLNVFRWLAEHPIGARICETTRQDEPFMDFPALVLRQNPANVKLLQYLYEQGLFGEDGLNEALPYAVKCGQPLAVLQWLVDHLPGLERLPECCEMDKAAARGRLEVLQYLQRLQLSAFTRNTFYPGDDEDTVLNVDARLWCTTTAMDEAAANGHLDVPT